MKKYTEHLLDISKEIIQHPKFANLSMDEKGKQLLELDRLSMNVLVDFLQQHLSPEQAKQHTQIARTVNPDAAADYLRETIPNYDAGMIAALDQFKLDYLAQLK